jgi:hypothetical protein
MEVVLGMLVIMLVSVAIGSLIGAIALRAAAQWIQKMDVPFGKAFVTCLLASIANAFIGFAVGFLMGTGTQSREAIITANLFMLPFGFFVLSGIVSSQIQIPFGRACIVSLSMIGIILVICLIVTVPAIFIMKFTM